MKTEVPHTYGAEVEKPVAQTTTGEVGLVDNSYFERLAERLQTHDPSTTFHRSDVDLGKILGVHSALGVENSPVQAELGVDNAMNLLETATPVTSSLHQLDTVLHLDAALTRRTLLDRNLGAVNLSIHPLANRSMDSYSCYVAPKGIYPYLWYRGWDHSAGIDARAQNSPATGVQVENAAVSASVVIGAGAALIGIFGNSPFEEGKRSDFKESRLTMWDRMLKNSSVPGDLRTSRFPDKPFANLADYFKWMFGEGTGIHFVVGEGAEGGGYKGLGNRILIVEGNPSVLDYLSGEERNVRYLSDIKAGRDVVHTVAPQLEHMATMQFAQFAGARIRYVLNDSASEIDLREFVRACKGGPGRSAEEILAPAISSMWIEGRDPGNNLPDRDMNDVGGGVADSVLVSPSAIQAGLLRNLNEARALIGKYNWQDLGCLRVAAVRDGLQGAYNGIAVQKFAQEIVEVAGRGLSAEEQWMLAYPNFVLKTAKSGADRAIEMVERQGVPLDQALARLVMRRIMVV